MKRNDKDINNWFRKGVEPGKVNLTETVHSCLQWLFSINIMCWNLSWARIEFEKENKTPLNNADPYISIQYVSFQNIWKTNFNFQSVLYPLLVTPSSVVFVKLNKGDGVGVSGLLHFPDLCPGPWCCYAELKDGAVCFSAI